MPHCRLLRLLILFGCGLLFVGKHSAAEAPFDLQTGDRVAFVGATFIEREGNYGAIETALTLRNRDQAGITYRNLGWSGDTVWGESRAYFGKREEGYKNLFNLLNELKPTVIYVAYGSNEAFAGESGIAEFEKQAARLFADLKKLTPRVRVIKPLLTRSADSPLPTASAEHNNRLALYAASLQKLANEQEFLWIELKQPDQDATYNGIHYDAAGYQQLVDLNQITPTKLDWHDPNLGKLIAAIRAKNELFFHRWRPANQTYLFGFRKHEQGQNAKEIAQFDPLIAEREKEIAELVKAVQ